MKTSKNFNSTTSTINHSILALESSMSSDYESEEDIPTYMLSVTWKVPVDPIETIARVENYFAINVRFTAYLVSVAK